MNRVTVRCLLGTVLLTLFTATADAEEVTVNSILIAHRAGANADGIIAVVVNPSNTVTTTPGDLVTLRAAGVSEAVIHAIEIRNAPPASSPAPVEPDDLRLVDLVRLIKSGISESIVAEQVKQSGRPFDLSVNDLLYLKQNGVMESTIGSLMATRVGSPGAPQPTAAALAAPAELTWNDLVLVRPAVMKRSRPGRLVMGTDTLTWVDGNNPKSNFEFQISGLKKVWFTCQARTPENFCYQINFQIVKGDKYRFRDLNQETGSNASVLEVMEALRTHFPQVAFGPPDA